VVEVYPKVAARITYEERLFLMRLAEQSSKSMAAAFKEGLSALSELSFISPTDKEFKHQPEPARVFPVRVNSVEEAAIDETLQRWSLRKGGMTVLFRTIIVHLMGCYPEDARVARLQTLEKMRELLLLDLTEVEDEIDRLNG